MLGLPTRGKRGRGMWRGCALSLAVALLAGWAGAQTDEERIAELEQQLQELREAARGRLSCTAEGSFVSITPIEVGGDVTGYAITNVTSADAADAVGATVVEVALSAQDTDIVLPGMVLRVSRADEGASDAPEPFEIAGLSDLTEGMDVWGVVGGNMLTWVFGCVFFGIVVALEKRYQCIGGEKIHEMVEQHHYLQKELKAVIHVIKGEDPDGPPTEEAGDTMSMIVEGAEGLGVQDGAFASAIGLAAGHKDDLGKGATLAAQLAAAKNGDSNAKKMLAAEALGQARKLEGQSPEELMEKGRNAAAQGSEMFHKVANDERTQQAVAAGKEKTTEALSKVKGGRFGRTSGGGQSGGMKSKPGGGFQFSKGSKPKSGSKESGTKFQNPMMGRVTMSNPMNRTGSSPKASSDKSESLLTSELGLAEDGGED